MRLRSTITSLAIIAAALTSAPVIAAERTNQGEELFEFHGCLQCHGSGGKSPASNVVPAIGGLPSDEIIVKEKKILSGEGETDESKLMHAAIYSPARCDAPPTDAELQSIASWLSAQ